MTRIISQCVYCGMPLTALTLTIDHVIPTIRGGSNDRHNKAPACSTCNQEKGPLTAFEYIASRGNKAELKAMMRKVQRIITTITAPETPAISQPELHRREPTHQRAAWAIEQDRRLAADVAAAQERRARAKIEGRKAGT